MARSKPKNDGDQEELLTGQTVFKGPRKIQKILSGSDDEGSEE